MGHTKSPLPVVRILAVITRHETLFDWTRQQAETHWGPVQLASPRFVFDQTRYYEATMGAGLFKQFLAFQKLIDPGGLARCKCETNAWEESCQQSANWPDSRALNLDPGYVTEGKLILASTKDHAHRIYLDQGIFAEVTLHFHAGAWQAREWTFPDYRQVDYHAFLNEVRAFLRRRLGRSTADDFGGKLIR